MGKPRLPWKRGPAAWRVKRRADEILAALAAAPSPLVSLRGAARLLGLSTQPLRDWAKQGYLSRTGPRGRFTVPELERWAGITAGGRGSDSSWKWSRPR